MYEVTDSAVLWKGKRLSGADPASFEILAPILGRDAQKLYVLGKPSKIDPDKFEVLSDSYARDAQAVYLIMATKLKPVKSVDVMTFQAVGDTHGIDATNAFFRDKRMRLQKGRGPADLRPLGHVYATDGEALYFGTERHALPDSADVSSASLRLKWFDDNEFSLPPLCLEDGQSCWVALPYARELWRLCAGADFDTLEVLADAEGSFWQAAYARDRASVWHQGTEIVGVAPQAAHVLAPGMLTDGSRLWMGDTLLPYHPDEIGFIGRHAMRLSETDEGLQNGVLLHHGDHVAFHAADGRVEKLAHAEDGATRPSLTDALRDVFETLFAVFSTYAPLQWPPNDLFDHLEANPVAVEVPAFQAHLTEQAELCLTLEDRHTLKQPATCWYTLACAFWAHAKGKPADFLPYPALGNMQPRATDMQVELVKRHPAAFVELTCALDTAGHTEATQMLAHIYLYLARQYRRDCDDEVQDLANLPRSLMQFLHYDPAHYGFEVTTNLAVSRLIVEQDWLAAEDMRDRIDCLDTLHAAVLDTNKTAYFFKEIIPVLMAYHKALPQSGLRELAALVLDASLIKGQVTCQVDQEFHHAEMLPVIEYCIEAGINTLFNRARRAEALWALDRDAEAESAAEALIAEIGEDAVLPGVYGNRLMYRAPRLWFLHRKCDLCWRKAPSTEAHAERLAKLQDELAALISRFGPESEKWKEVKDIKREIKAYAKSIEKL